jgi:hypothetical protein
MISSRPSGAGDPDFFQSIGRHGGIIPQNLRSRVVEKPVSKMLGSRAKVPKAETNQKRLLCSVSWEFGSSVFQEKRQQRAQPEGQGAAEGYADLSSVPALSCTRCTGW